MKLAKSYEPKLYEAAIYNLWEQSRAFKPQGTGTPYSVVVPPPNANGNLHVGHALTFAIQDIAVRYHRSQGDRVVYIPGADHAGFETQVVFERQLQAEGKSRFDYSREGLYDRIFAFVQQNRENLIGQIRRLGASVDWKRFMFTLDEPVIQQAYETFHKMWDEGLIYRGERLVNFCTYHGTAFADIEIEYAEEQGFLWQIKYPLVDGSGHITIATTRPETMLGDTAVAVNPKDKRYLKMIGKTVKLPLTNREIPIIADPYVDPKFGTGALKITPAHDPNDYEIGQRHDLPFITVIGFDGKMAHEAGESFRGLNVTDARQAVIHALKEQGLLGDVSEHPHSVAHCYKCGTVIEPLLKEQWFIDMKPLTKPVISTLKKDKVKFYPASKRQQLIRYLEGIKDWNISRQIAWGIPIPAFQNENDPGDWIFDDRIDQETITVNNQIYRRDPDVFDTWFSSGSWPYVTTGYPNNKDFDQFYPLSLMETGFDILMQWVSRMLVLGLYITGKPPFKAVYLHGLVLDAHGQKMSKSKGNVVDPMLMIDEYGSDALRIGVISGQTPGHNQPLIPAKIIGGRNFCNKLWNIARFIENISPNNREGNTKPVSPADHWILARYQNTLDSYNKFMATYRFSEAYELLHAFIWDDLADWYIETAKLEANPALLLAILEAILVLVHPFAPFVTETIWQTLNLKSGTLLSGHNQITLTTADSHETSKFEKIKTIVTAIRSTLQVMDQKPSDVKVYYLDKADQPFVSLIQHLTNLADIELLAEGKGTTLLPDNQDWWIDIQSQAIASYKTKLTKMIQTEQGSIQTLTDRLSNKSYLENAPKHLVKETETQLEEAKQRLMHLQEDLKRF